MKNIRVLALIFILVMVSTVVFSMEIPPWPKNPEDMTEHITYIKRTTTSDYETKIQEDYGLSYSWYDTTEDGNLLEISRIIRNDTFVNGEHVPNMVSGILFQLLLAVEYDENMFATDVHGLDELDSRIDSIPDPYLKQVLYSVVGGEVYKNRLLTQWNDTRILYLQAIEELNQALEWDFEQEADGLFIPFTAQLLAERGTYQGEEVYVVHFNQFYRPVEEKSLEKFIVQSILDLPLPSSPDIKINAVEMMTFNTSFVTKDDLRPLSTDRYFYCVIEAEVVGEVMEIILEQEFMNYTVPVVLDSEYEYGFPFSQIYGNVSQ